MRLGKSLQEISKAKTVLQTEVKDPFGRLVKFILHVIFGVYWVFDNLCLMTDFNLTSFREADIRQHALAVKVIGLIIAVLFNFRMWLRLHHTELKTRIELKILQGQRNLEAGQKLIALIIEQWKIFLLSVKIFADLIPSVARSTFAKSFFKIKIPRLAQAIGGFISAFVACILVATQLTTNPQLKSSPDQAIHRDISRRFLKVSKRS